MRRSVSFWWRITRIPSGICSCIRTIGLPGLSRCRHGDGLEGDPNSRCDVLISDIGLPDGDGWQLMEKLGSHRPRFAIAMSGYGTSNDQRKSRAAGYDHHLVKPFIPDALLALLTEAEKAKESQA